MTALAGNTFRMLVYSNNSLRSNDLRLPLVSGTFHFLTTFISQRWKDSLKTIWFLWVHFMLNRGVVSFFVLLFLSYRGEKMQCKHKNTLLFLIFSFGRKRINFLKRCSQFGNRFFSVNLRRRPCLADRWTDLFGGSDLFAPDVLFEITNAGAPKNHSGYQDRCPAEGECRVVPSNLIVKQIKQIDAQKRNLFLCKCTLSSASKSVRQMSPHMLFNKFQVWTFFLNASAGYWKRCGGPHVARGPDVGPHWLQEFLKYFILFGHNFGTRNARKSIKGSYNSLKSNKTLSH